MSLQEQKIEVMLILSVSYLIIQVLLGLVAPRSITEVYAVRGFIILCITLAWLVFGP